ncbi:MAG: acyl-[acyl-carrier-protein]--UDP-N-acetylglucosamine O-acyltransferase [Chlamydiae bacterium RIFCSPHIGHO2_12_FULL_49_11]|nr:MAG: acyl-[acyl-carrier-protein]--UDP-N-acetylglucosamine O-acyltransferase [Chlamydiae bacterium RIFCSPHIGHO2_12_FULL_49_11]
MSIHHTASIHPKAKIGKKVVIGPFVVIDSPDVVLGDGVCLKAQVYISGAVTIGEGTIIWPFASIGAETQDLKYRGEQTRVIIGKHCRIRESVTINSSCGEGSTVSVGDYTLIMAYCHVAHNCSVGSHVVMANGATLAGHVSIGNWVVLGGLSAVHQFVRIGDYAMIGGGAMLGRDLPPYTIGSGYPFRIAGLNIVGLKRNNIGLETRKKLTGIYRITFDQGLDWENAREKILSEFSDMPEAQNWVRFCDESNRGLVVAMNKKRLKKNLLEVVEV